MYILKKIISIVLLGLGVILLTGWSAFAQDSTIQSQSAPSNRAFLGNRLKAPQGYRWQPGHFEVLGGKRIWIRGQYEQVKGAQTSLPAGASQIPVPPNPQPNITTKDASQTPNSSIKTVPLPYSQQLSPPYAEQPAASTQQQNLGPMPSTNGFVRPFNKSNSATGKSWIPGHFENVGGQMIWMRGHYADEQGKAAGPPKGNFNPPAMVTSASSNVQPQGWAVVIGISKYKFSSGSFADVRYAANDAQEFYNFIRSSEGGGLSPDHILFLQDEEASLKNIRYAFFDFLKKALEEDFVVIYFSGHGTPEEDNPDNLYLLAYDSRPDQIASSAFPMWDIETALKRYIKSNKVIMFADACHSAGISNNITTRSIDKKNQVNKYLIEIARAKKGRAIFTASEAGELSQESQKWGGGHGVFTYFLIEGLKGKADMNDNNVVTLGEVMDYVSENVRRETGNTQHPNTSGFFDRSFPLAILSN